MPQAKQVFKKSEQDQNPEDKFGKNINLSHFYINYDEDKFAFTLLRIGKSLTVGTSDGEEDSQTHEADSRLEATPPKRYSKREKKINRKFQESGYAVYSPEISSFEEKPAKSSTLGKRPRRRKNSSQLNPVEKKRKQTTKEPTQSEPTLKEEDLEEHYCICRFK